MKSIFQIFPEHSTKSASKFWFSSFAKFACPTNWLRFFRITWRQDRHRSSSTVANQNVSQSPTKCSKGRSSDHLCGTFSSSASTHPSWRKHSAQQSSPTICRRIKTLCLRRQARTYPANSATCNAMSTRGAAKTRLPSIHQRSISAFCIDLIAMESLSNCLTL